MSDEGKIVDARYLRVGEEINSRLEIEFPCHVAMISYRLDHTHHQMASMPQRMMGPRKTNWWLYCSLANVGMNAVLSTCNI
jgi:hypothetical protein